MSYKPYQNIITGLDTIQSKKEIDIHGTVKIRIQTNPNIENFYFSINRELDSSSIKDWDKIYVDKTGNYELDLSGISIMNTLYLYNIAPGQRIIVDTLRETF